MNPNHSPEPTEKEIADLLHQYSITPADQELVAKFGAQMTADKLEQFVAHFYDWLGQQPEYAEHFGGDDERLERVQNIQVAYWTEFFEGKITPVYVSNRRRVGEVHARIGLSLPVYFAAVNQSLEIFTKTLTNEPIDGPTSLAINKLALFDTAVVVDTYNRLTNHKISQQTQALMEMSTPVAEVWENILLLPVVGIIDSRRAQDIMNTMLKRIGETQATVFILDISGVAVVDTAVANHLIKITKATRLMGCHCTISGISPTIAQTIVELGIEVGDVKTTSTLRDAFEAALKTTNASIA